MAELPVAYVVFVLAFGQELVRDERAAKIPFENQFNFSHGSILWESTGRHSP